MVFRDFCLVEFLDDKGGILIWAKSKLPAQLNPKGASQYMAMNAFQFVNACEDPRILAAVRSNPNISEITKALTSGLNGLLDTCQTEQGIAYEATMEHLRQEIVAAMQA